ncbi:ribokinase [Rhizosaccharibacter radicis]|uniref:Ribokinase n=1 Tax=Rhizosaccharibacter radicis TaxID=2782605 RepID=A0ABT1VY02_9PROT|nr:ribokinase [Acetobacteraceae bacterium KSS12]
MTLPLVLSFGSVNADIVAYGDRLPRPGETVHAGRYNIGLGGKGANQAAAAGRLAAGNGVTAALGGRIGDDPFGKLVRERLEGFGVDLSGLLLDEANPTGIALIGVDAAAENSITVVGAANMAVGEDDVARLADPLDRAAVLLLQLEIPVGAAVAAARRTRAAGGTVVLDPAPVPAGGVPDALLALADLVTPNETEAERLVGLRPTTPEEAARAALLLRERGAGGAIVKLGARGVFFSFRGEEGFVPPFEVRSVDSVAAGDSFNAGLAVAIAAGKSPPDAVRYAAACGALATTRPGAADAAPFPEEVEALVAAAG